jgi:hypothetical protein
MLNDLAALTPPFLMCAAFLFGLGAFLRHEMKRAKSSGDDDDAEDSGLAAASENSENPGQATATSRAVRDSGDEPGWPGA